MVVPKGSQTSDYISSNHVVPVGGGVLNILSAKLLGKAGPELDFLMEQLFGMWISLKQFTLQSGGGGVEITLSWLITFSLSLSKLWRISLTRD